MTKGKFPPTHKTSNGQWTLKKIFPNTSYTSHKVNIRWSVLRLNHFTWNLNEQFKRLWDKNIYRSWFWLIFPFLPLSNGNKGRQRSSLFATIFPESDAAVSMKNPFPLVKRAVFKTLSKLGRMILFGLLKNKKGTENIPRAVCIRKRWNAHNHVYFLKWATTLTDKRVGTWKWALFPSHLDQLLSSLGITKDWGQRPIPYPPTSFTRDRFWAE